MKITETIQKKGVELAKKHGYKALFVNDKDEFFTSKSFAANSVGNDKERYAEVNIGVDKVVEKSTTDLDKTDEVIAKINECETASDVEAIVKAEADGKNRKSVIAAAAKKIQSLEKKAE